MFAKQQCWDLSGTEVKLLNRQQQWVEGQSFSVFLLQQTAPLALLNLNVLSLLRNLWRGQLVVCSEALGQHITSALLDAGAIGVICARHSFDGTTNKVSAFFEDLYASLMRGTSVLFSLSQAEERTPEMAGTFALFRKLDGVVCTLPK
jgi:hypothetical protein